MCKVSYHTLIEAMLNNGMGISYYLLSLDTELDIIFELIASDNVTWAAITGTFCSFFIISVIVP